MKHLTREEAYQAMYEHTKDECAHCRVPHSCCSPEYCEMAEDIARRQGVELARTGHPTLLFMSLTGCTVPPHLRPLCTLHTCAVNSLGFKPGDPVWTTRYFKLRNLIEQREADRG